MNLATPSTGYLKDYSPPPFLIASVELDIDLIDESDARIQATLAVKRNQAPADRAVALQLRTCHFSGQTDAARNCLFVASGATKSTRTLSPDLSFDTS